MPPIPGMGFAPPIEGKPAASIDLTRRSQKWGSEECVTDPTKSTKKRRGPKKMDIVELDDVKEDMELSKNVGL
jgi:hypothetical protein